MPTKDPVKLKEQRQKYDAKRAGTRTRNYATVVYPESAPDNWKEIVSDLKVETIISPLHDSDVNPTGEPKKVHYHVMIMWETVKTQKQAKEVFELFGGVGCETVNSIRGMARYFCHLDNPEKARYSEDDVVTFGGVDYYALIGLAVDKHKAIREMIQFCIENGIVEYCDLMEYCMTENESWFRVLCDNGSVAMQNYLRSKRHKILAQS